MVPSAQCISSLDKVIIKCNRTEARQKKNILKKMKVPEFKTPLGIPNTDQAMVPALWKAKAGGSLEARTSLVKMVKPGLY